MFSKMYTSLHVKHRLFLSDFNETWNFSTYFEKNTPTSNLMKIHQVGAELFHADRQTNMTKLAVAFHNFANLPKHLDRQ